MNEVEIRDTMLQACMAIRRMPDDARPARLKAINIGYTHDASDLKDQEPQARRRINTRNEIKLVEAAEELVKLEQRETHRRCLWAWAMAKAGRGTFKAWCRSEFIHENTGKRRADAAIRAIAKKFKCNTLLHSEIIDLDLLIVPPKTGYKGITLVKPVWRDEEAQTARDCIVAGWRGMKAARNAARRAR